MLVEDQAAVRRLTASLLTQAGYAVTEAADGTAALALLEKRGQPVDLLVTDVMMPLMTGPELAGCVRRRWASTRVLYISGYSAEGSMPESVADAGMKYLAKPFTRAELLSKVREALDGAPEA